MNTLYLHHVQPSSLPPTMLTHSFGVSIHSKTLSKKKKKIDQGSSTQEAEAGETFLGSITTWFTQ